MKCEKKDKTDEKQHISTFVTNVIDDVTPEAPHAGREQSVGFHQDGA